MYQALYRKYRPQKFDDVIGQSHITETLKNQVNTNHLSHAYIFIGTRGTGKTTCARILAKAVNCENPIDGNPCCECASCRGILDGSIMDVVELDAASNNGVDNVRALRDEAVFSPANAKKRVYIIDEVHMLSTPAFNALLKILEEPPEHLMFVLATTELQKVPATILSRCQRHIFKRIDLDVLARYLISISKKEQLSLNYEAARLIAGLGEGSVRDSLSILDQCSSCRDITVDAVYSAVGLAGNKKITSLYSSIVTHNIEKAIMEFDSMWNDGKDPSVILKELSNLNRDVLMIKIAPKYSEELVYGGYDRQELNALVELSSIEELCYIGEELTKTLGNIVNPKMNAELCIVKLASGIVEGISLNSRAVTQSGKRENISNREGVSKGINSDSIVATVVEPRLSSFAEESNSIDTTGYNIDATNIASQVNDEQIDIKKDLWCSICSEAKKDLPMDIIMQLNNSSAVQGQLVNDTLTIKATPGLTYSRINSVNVISAFAKSASAVCKKPINVRVVEFSSQSEAKRNIDELKSFSEVKFI